MPQPFVVLKNPHTVDRFVVNLDLEPDDNLSGLELRVDFINVPNEAAYLHSSARIFPNAEPNRDGYDFIIVNPRTLDCVEANVLATHSYEPGETNSSFSYSVRCGSRVSRFPRQHRCPDVSNSACAAANCDVLGCKVASPMERTGRLTDDDIRFLFELTHELDQRLDEARIDFEAEIRNRYPDQAIFVREGYAGSQVLKADVMPLRRDPAGC